MYDALCNIARAYRKLGQTEKSLPYLKRATALKPEAPDAMLTWAEALTSLGRHDEAEPAYRAVIAKGGSRAAALFGLSTSRKQTPEHALLPEIETALRDLQPAETAARIQLSYAAAKTAMDLGLHDIAFGHLQAAKQTAPVTFDLALHNERQKRLIALFNSTFLASRADYGDPSSVPVFIVGMPRSGTSLTEQILSSHPQVYGAGELNYLHDLANQYLFSLGDGATFVEKVVGMTRPAARAAAQSYLDKSAAFAPPGIARITDKMPHNFTFVGLIAMLFPRARIIHVRRNPIDNCLSIYANPFNAAHGYAGDLSTLGQYYVKYVELMAHWRKVVPDRLLDIQYEDLVTDQEAVTRQMLAFIGLDWDPASLDYIKNARSVGTISRWQVRQPLYTTSIARWRPYERYLGPLIDAVLPIMEGDAGVRQT